MHPYLQLVVYSSLPDPLGASLLRPGFQHPGLPRSLPCPGWKKGPWNDTLGNGWKWWIYDLWINLGVIWDHTFSNHSSRFEGHFTLKPGHIPANTKTMTSLYRKVMQFRRAELSTQIQVSNKRNFYLCMINRGINCDLVSSTDLAGAPVTLYMANLFDILEQTYLDSVYITIHYYACICMCRYTYLYTYIHKE